MVDAAKKECENATTVFENFELLGFPYPEDLKFLFVFFFLLMYILSLSGNSLILLVVAQEPQLHKPMYWFLCHLSMMDMMVSSVTLPKLITWLVMDNGVISFAGCVTQLFFFHFLGCTECFLYTVMALDRFIAICKPLHYGTIMTYQVSFCLAVGSWFGGSIHGAIHSSLTSHLPYGWRNQVNYVLCDIPALLKLACADTSLNEMVTLIDIGFVAMACFLLIVTSYIYIVSAILRIPTSKGRRRAFSTCTAHITLVVIYYVPVVYNYVRPPSQDSFDGVVVMFYAAATPFLNPLIYTLRNKEMKDGVHKLCRQPSFAPPPWPDAHLAGPATGPGGGEHSRASGCRQRPAHCSLSAQRLQKQRAAAEEAHTRASLPPSGDSRRSTTRARKSPQPAGLRREGKLRGRHQTEKGSERECPAPAHPSGARPRSAANPARGPLALGSSCLGQYDSRNQRIDSECQAENPEIQLFSYKVIFHL
ncbi:olfactory receptor 10G6-like [Heteronotia binoei]|uniref:olfactory receptor 10G6-like n=1 Tax=Heteronotia binoei TaxID=13085 RepID=UPI00292D7FAB|nr:olfactory receptor 10G6-like [Heteronotia binoei]